MDSITTCSFFKVQGFSNKWWAFTQMRLGLRALRKTEGLTFCKFLGSGGRSGFSAFPNFGAYVLFCVWNSEESARRFFAEHPFFKTYLRKSYEQFTVYLNSAESHGSWDGRQPFTQTRSLSMDAPVLVLTRARIRLHKLWSFWRKVGGVSQSLENQLGLAFSMGVGEWPLFEQATVSLWKTQKEMLDYAYKNEHHKQVVQLTRKLNWYKEALFARFVPYKCTGFWEGKSVED
jgi:hypothetical protein